MHQSLVKFSESKGSNHMPSLAEFTTTTPELKFSVHTGQEYELTGNRDIVCGAASAPGSVRKVS
jgi:hypothetical protein